MNFIASSLFTLVSENANFVRTERVYMLGSDRKVVVSIKHNSHIYADAYVLEPHDAVWYDGDGEEHVERREWLRVSHDDDAPVELLLARAYGALMCYRA